MRWQKQVMWSWGLGCGVAVLALCVSLAWGQSRHRTNQRYIFENGIELGTGGGGSQIGGGSLRVAYCGELAENGTTYMGPAELTTVEPALAGTACDALDNTTEATADVVLTAGRTLYPRYMRCITDGTLGAGETLAFQLRDDTTNVTGVTCSLVEAGTICEVYTPEAPGMAAGSASAVRAIEASNNADDNGKCVVVFQVE